jgi:protein PhnA
MKQAMHTEPACPKCHSESTYADGNLWVCAECFHEWAPSSELPPGDAEAAPAGVRDAHGNLLQDGDTIAVIKDLKVKGSSSVVKVGTKVKGIRLVDGGDGHDIACKIEGFGAMNLKSEYVKKV